MCSRSRLNPVLETKREALLAEEQDNRDSLLQAYKKSVLNTKDVHSSFLFTTENGLSILKCICCLVSSVQPNMFNTSWLDLAAKLGYNDAEIKCINNLQGPVHDPTQQILQYFAATRDGTVGDLLQALLDLGFLPAVHQTQQYIEGFLSEVETSKSDAINVQVNMEDGVKDLVKAANFKPFVPIIFDSLSSKTKEITVLEKNYVSVTEGETLQMSQPQPRVKPHKKKHYCKIVMLSFASDGLAIAKKMALILRATKNNKGFSIGVVILSENEEEVLKNPGKVINTVLSQVDFVIPVLTEGYFSALMNPNPQARLLDERYIQYIHDTMLSNFIQNHCINLHVRPIIPKQEVNTVSRKKEFNMNSIFKAYRTDDEMEPLALSILKSRREKIFI